MKRYPFAIQFFAPDDGGTLGQLTDTLNAMGSAFEEYKKTNDERLEEIKKGGQGAELEQKLTRLEADIQKLEEGKSAIEAKLNRPGVGGGSDPERSAYRKAFEGFVRKGNEAGLKALQHKDVQVGVDADGGYAVPEEMSRTILELEGPSAPMREVSTVMSFATEHYKQLVDLGGTDSGWVGETDTRPDTASPKLGEITPFWGEIYAQPKATQTSLDDMFFNVEDWLAAGIAKEFAKKENAAFTLGDGVKKPKGFLAYPTSMAGDATRPFGTLQYFKTGVADAFPATAPADLLINVIHGIKPGYRAGSRWMLNNLTLATARKWKDSEGNYLWQPGLQAGVPNVLFGYGYVENEDLPGIGANAFSLAFGSWKEAYTVCDRIGIRILRDPFTQKPYVKFYTTKRVGGMVVNSEALKLVKCEA